MRGKPATRATSRCREATAGASMESPPLVTMRKTKRRGVACDLNETIDDGECRLTMQGRQSVTLGECNVDDEALQRASSEAPSEAPKAKRARGNAVASTKGKLKRTASAREREEKENNCTTPRRVRKRQTRQPLIPIVNESVNTEESPPIFAFKKGNTLLKIRKLRKERAQPDNKKRLDELAAFFNSLDNERLDYL